MFLQPPSYKMSINCGHSICLLMYVAKWSIFPRKCINQSLKISVETLCPPVHRRDDHFTLHFFGFLLLLTVDHACSSSLLFVSLITSMSKVDVLTLIYFRLFNCNQTLVLFFRLFFKSSNQLRLRVSDPADGLALTNC